MKRNHAEISKAEAVKTIDIDDKTLNTYLTQLAMRGGIRSLHQFLGLTGKQVVNFQGKDFYCEGKRQRSNFNNADFAYVDFSWSILTNQTFQSADFSCAIVKGIQASTANFLGANFRGRNLEGATFVQSTCMGADFEGANFSKATLTRTNFSQSNLAWVDFSLAFVNATNFDGAILFQTTGLSKEQLAQAAQHGAIITINDILFAVKHKEFPADKRYCCAKIALRYAEMTQDQELKQRCIDTADTYIKEIPHSIIEPRAYAQDKQNAEIALNKATLLYTAHTFDKGSPLHCSTMPDDIFKIVTIVLPIKDYP